MHTYLNNFRAIFKFTDYNIALLSNTFCMTSYVIIITYLQINKHVKQVNVLKQSIASISLP